MGPFFKDSVPQTFTDSEGEQEELGDSEVEIDDDDGAKSGGEDDKFMEQSDEEDSEVESEEDIAPRSRGAKMSKKREGEENSFEEVPQEEVFRVLCLSSD